MASLSGGSVCHVMYYCCRVWDVGNGQMLNTLVHHCEAVLHLRFSDATMVTCSKVRTMNCHVLHACTERGQIFCLFLCINDVLSHYTCMCYQDRTIAVWDMRAPHDIVLRRVLVGHRAAVNVVDFDDRYIVSASGDRTIKVKHFPWVGRCSTV